jgi:hypothetical protein
MENKKAYFVDNETYELYELSASKRKQLEKKHPKWVYYDCERNTNDLNEVLEFFRAHGKLLAHQSWRNVFVGLTV